MPRGTYLTSEEKGKILAFREEGFSFRNIARKIGRSHNVVWQFLHNPDAYGSLKRGGPKKKLSKRDERRIIRAASNNIRSLNDLKSDLNLNVSKSTVYRVIRGTEYLLSQGLKPAPRLTPAHREARRQFALRNLGRDWTKVRVQNSLTIFFFLNTNHI